MKIELNHPPLIQGSNATKTQEVQDAFEKANEMQEEQLLKGESSAVLSGAKMLKEAGYTVDKESVEALKEYLSGTETEVKEKLYALEIALQKDMPLKDALLSGIRISNKLSLLDFIDEGGNQVSGGDRAKENLEDPVNRRKEFQSHVNKQEKLLSKLSTLIDKELEGFVFERKEIKGEKEESYFKALNYSSLKNESLSGGQDGNLTSRLKDENEAETQVRDLALSLKETFAELGSEELLFWNQIFSSSQLSFDFSAEDSDNTLFVERRITQKIIDLKRDFKELKQSLAKDVAEIDDKPLRREDKIELLNKSIDRLDRLIMKSELSLYMDLKNERSLIQISSKLQIARKHLEQGDLQASEKLLKEVKTSLDAVRFEPSIKKAYAVFSEKIFGKDYSYGEVLQWARKSTEDFVRSEKSPLTLLQYLRKMGLNHEIERFQEQQTIKSDQKQGELKQVQNLKELLLRLQTQNEGAKDTAKLSGLIEQIEGNQLKNKIMESKEAQSMELNLPIELNGRIKNVKVFIKSPQKMLKLDWENFDMYFVLNTDKLGELGIRVGAVQRQLSVKIINDNIENIDSKSKFKQNFKEEIESFGYRLVKMLTESWNFGAESKERSGMSKTPESPLKERDGASSLKTPSRAPSQRIDIKI